MINGYLGCHTCRRRHQKCDEGKPACFNCHLRGVQCEGYGITLTDFTAQNSQKGQMRAKLKRDGPGTDLRQSTAANVSDVSLDTDLHNMGSISQPPEEENMSFLEALSAESLNGNFNTDFDMSISSSDSNPINCTSTNTWATDCDFLDENADILDSSLLGSFCDPHLYQAPADPFDQTLFCHCEFIYIRFHRLSRPSWSGKRHRTSQVESIPVDSN